MDETQLAVFKAILCMYFCIASSKGCLSEAGNTAVKVNGSFY